MKRFAIIALLLLCWASVARTQVLYRPSPTFTGTSANLILYVSMYDEYNVTLTANTPIKFSVPVTSSTIFFRINTCQDATGGWTPTFASTGSAAIVNRVGSAVTTTTANACDTENWTYRQKSNQIVLESIAYNTGVQGSGINSGSAGNVAWYATTGKTISGNTGLTTDASGNLTANSLILPAQSPNTFFGGPLSGSAAAPTFRVVGAADIPATSVTIANASVTGTTLNKLAKVTGAPSTGVIAATTDTSAVIGICVQGCGTTGSGVLQQNGISPCVFDGSTTAGDYVQISSSVAGDCHDVGATYPTSGGEVLGRVTSTNVGAGAYNLNLFTPDVVATGSSSNPIYTHTLTCNTTTTAVVNSASAPATDVENLVLSANCATFTMPASTAIADGEVIHIKVYQPSGAHNYTFPSTLTGGAGTTVAFMASNGCASMPSMPTGTNHKLLLDVLYDSTTATYDIVSCPTDGA